MLRLLAETAHGLVERDAITYVAAVSSLREGFLFLFWLRAVELLDDMVAWSYGAERYHAQRSGQRLASRRPVGYRRWKLLAEMALGRVERDTIMHNCGGRDMTLIAVHVATSKQTYLALGPITTPRILSLI